jgi:hypothetical protein
LPKTINPLRWVAVAALVGGGIISALLQAWRGDPQAITVVVVGVALIAAQALIVVLVTLYEDMRLSRRALLIAVGVFYFGTIAVFAAAFAYLDHQHGIHRPDATPLSPVSALYLSVATITGLGYTDRYPESDPAKLLAMLEVLTGLACAVFIFALLSNVLRERSSSTQ